jgi:hypothetical protein
MDASLREPSTPLRMTETLEWGNLLAANAGAFAKADC